MTKEGIAVARAMLSQLEAAIAERDLATLVDLCTEDVVLFGAAKANFGLEEVGDYLRLVVESNTVRWLLDRWSVLQHDDMHLLAAAEGQVEFDDGTGAERSDFRLTLCLVRVDKGWRLKHFHGSVPEA